MLGFPIARLRLFFPLDHVLGLERLSFRLPAHLVANRAKSRLCTLESAIRIYEFLTLIDVEFRLVRGALCGSLDREVKRREPLDVAGSSDIDAGKSLRDQSIR